MSPEQNATESEDDKEIKTEGEPGLGSSTAQKQPAKRRTKTGCLTCRKRRIKCGEERPICKNCIKSKRECAGYVQPLVYKQQQQHHHHHGNAQLIQDARPSASSFSEDASFSFNAPLAPIWANVSQSSHLTQTVFNAPLPFAEARYLAGAPHTHHPGPAFPPTPGDSFPGYSQPIDAGQGFVDWRRHSIAAPSLIEHEIAASSRGDVGIWQPPHQEQEPPWLDVRSTWASQSHPSTESQEGWNVTESPVVYSGYSADGHLHINTRDVGEPQLRRYSVHGFVQHSTIVTAIPTLGHASSTPLDMSAAGQEYEDPDDPFDVEMDDKYSVTQEEAKQGLTAMLERQHQTRDSQHRSTETQRKSTRTVAVQGPSIVHSPLHDERNERLFCHYVEVTGKSMSIFERPLLGVMKSGLATLWSYDMAVAALSHSALAHAILALSALHVAKLQQTSEDPAVKHFTYAVRRVGKLLGLPQRRHDIATLAAILVLGFHEVMAADHSRWTLHLAGAKKLIVEHDYAGMTRAARRMRLRAKKNIGQWAARFTLTDGDYVNAAGIPESLLDDVEWEVDEGLISKLTGYRIDYNHQFQPHFELQNTLDDLTAKDVKDYKAKMDMRWYYCKQDMFQSMVSGDPLLLPFDQWIFCPPRGQIGKIDHAYATFDHLLLIMARLADFGGKDRTRKQRAVATSGGEWRPPPGFFPSGAPSIPRAASHSTSIPDDIDRKGKIPVSTQEAKSSIAPSANEKRVRQSKPAIPSAQSNATGPSFHGMIPPPPAPVQMHSSFYAMEAQLRRNEPAESRVELEDSVTHDLESETANALREHSAITEAFDLFARSLGSDFDPQSPFGQHPIATPFGPALRYKTPTIACIWAFYHVGRIQLHRMHPHMPPAAMVSAGVTAHLTREHAQTIGKICAGLYDTMQQAKNGVLDPLLAGAVMETTFPMMFAGINYQDAAQRGWTISKLQDVVRLTGWQTSAAVAAACESAWVKMGEAGKGPPYVRTLDRNNKDARVNGTYRKADGDVFPINSPSEARSEHESPFVSHDRNLIGHHAPTRVHWALGLLAVEEDIKNLDLNKHPKTTERGVAS